MKGSRASRSHRLSDHASGVSVAERVERVLATRRLTLSQVSREIRVYSRRIPHDLVPHNFYYDLGLPGYSPRIEQVLALSRVSNYRLADWLAIFGFNLDDIPRLQAEFPATRTSLLDQTTYDLASSIGWFRDVALDVNQPAVAPLGLLLTPGHLRRIESLLAPEPSRFLYAKIGHQDTFAFPDLLPGSLVRADRRGVSQLIRNMLSNDSERFFLVEYRQGLVGCRLHARTKGRITLRAEALPFAQTELRLGSEARILGVLDWELRPFKIPRPEVPTASMRFLKPQAVLSAEVQTALSGVLERARLRSGLSFRKASEKSRWVADVLRDERYFCAPGSLTDFETGPRLPVHIHKLISLCILYSLGFRQLLAAAGLDSDDTGRESIPDQIMGRSTPASPEVTNEPGAREENRPGLLSSLIAEFEEIPLFLRRPLSAIAGLPGLSIRDVFWIGGRSDSLHPYLKDAIFVSVNRRIKKPVFLKRKSLWEQPLYILLLRDGTYLLAGCSVEGNTLILHPFADGLSRPRILRNGVDAEVVGKVTALFRRLR